MTKEEESQDQENPQSTEEEGTALNKEVVRLKKISADNYEEMMDGLKGASQAEEGPVSREYGPLAPADSDMAIALDHEGLSPPLLARKLKILLESVTPKWNKDGDCWDYFIDSELWRRVIEMVMKLRGDYAPEKRINVNIDMGLEELLKGSVGMTPEEAEKKIKDYIDVEFTSE